MESTEENTVLKEEKTGGCYVRQRYLLAVMAFLGLCNVSFLRNQVYVTVLAMLNNTHENGTHTGHTELLLENRNHEYHNGDQTNSNFVNTIALKPNRHQAYDLINRGSMNWSSTEEGLFLGAYYYGYVAGNIPGGWFVTRFGFRKTFPIAIFISSILNLFTPWASYTSVYLASILRCLTGFLQGVTVSAVTSIWSSWAPPFERSIMVSVSFSGFSFGYIIINPAAGFIAEYISWEAVFYITGGIAIVWSILFFTLFTETPDTNPRISHQERSYIEKSIGTFHTKISKRPSIPWKSLLTSKRVLAIICAHFYDAWFQCAIPAVLPTFLVNVLDYDMTQSGLVLMLPFALQWTVSVIGGKVTDKLRKSGRVSTTFIRKFNTCFALICSGWLTAGLGYVKDSDKLTMALVCISFAISGLAYAGYLSNPLDIAPRQASIIITISNTIACSSGFLGPLLAGYVVLDKTDISQWQVFFWSTCILGNVSAIIYGILASGVEQKWAQENVKVEINNNNDVDQLEKFELKNEI